MINYPISNNTKSTALRCPWRRRRVGRGWFYHCNHSTGSPRLIRPVHTAGFAGYFLQCVLLDDINQNSLLDYSITHPFNTNVSVNNIFYTVKALNIIMI